MVAMKIVFYNIAQLLVCQSAGGGQGEMALLLVDKRPI